MSDMVERVARAILIADRAWEHKDPLFHNWYEEAARAAIASMREPTEVEAVRHCPICGGLASERDMDEHELAQRELRAATIEECATIAEARWDGIGNKNGRLIATAIRALKERK